MFSARNRAICGFPAFGNWLPQMAVRVELMEPDTPHKKWSDLQAERTPAAALNELPPTTGKVICATSCTVALTAV